MSRWLSTRLHVISRPKFSFSDLILVPIFVLFPYLIAQAQQDVLPTDNDPTNNVENLDDLFRPQHTELEPEKKRTAEEVEALAEFEKFRERIEGEIERRKKSVEDAHAILKTYRAELESEHRELSVQEQNPTATREQTEATRNRQRLIRLYLWELERIEPLLEAKVIGIQDLEQEMHQWMARGSELPPGPVQIEIQRKSQELLHKVMEIRHRPFQNPGFHRGRQGVFYEVWPSGEVEPERININTEGLLAGGGTPRDLGALSKIRKPLRRMLRLRWKGSQLGLDTDHWNEIFVGKSLTQIKEEVSDELAKRGAIVPDDEDGMFGMHHPSNLPNLALLMQSFQTEMSPEHVGSGFSGGQTSFRHSFETSELAATAHLANGSFRFTIEDLALGLVLRVSFRQDGMLLITLDGERDLRITQKPDGRVQVFEVYQETLLHDQGTNFVDIYREHPDFVEMSLFPLLDQLGFIVPPTRYSPSIVQRVLQNLSSAIADPNSRAKQLIGNLESPNYDLREAATLELASHAHLFGEFVRSTFQDPQLSLELRSRLKRVIETYESIDQFQDELVIGLKLLDNREYLSSLRSRVSEHERSILARRIQELDAANQRPELAE